MIPLANACNMDIGFNGHIHTAAEYSIRLLEIPFKAILPAMVPGHTYTCTGYRAHKD